MSPRLTRLLVTLTFFELPLNSLLSVMSKPILSWLEEFPTYSVEHHRDFANVSALTSLVTRITVFLDLAYVVGLKINMTTFGFEPTTSESIIQPSAVRVDQLVSHQCSHCEFSLTDLLTATIR